MAVRLQLKLGVVTEQDRLARLARHDRRRRADDRIRRAHRRATSTCSSPRRVPGPRAREATRMVADTIRDEYYYDESAGIRVCLEKVIGVANKRLAHQRDKLGDRAPSGDGPIGVAVAVVRGSELYVATVGPAEAYLIRRRASRRCPTRTAIAGLPGEPSCSPRSGAARSPSATRSSSSRPTSSPGSAPTSSRTRWSPSTRSRRSSTSTTGSSRPTGTGSDGALAFEATEVAATQRRGPSSRSAPAEPLAGRARPLADPAGRQRDRRGRRRVGRRATARDAAGGVLRARDPAASRTCCPTADRRIPPGDALRDQPGDAAASGRRAPRLRRRRRWARRRGLVRRRQRPEEPIALADGRPARPRRRPEADLDEVWARGRPRRSDPQARPRAARGRPRAARRPRRRRASRRRRSRRSSSASTRASTELYGVVEVALVGRSPSRRPSRRPISPASCGSRRRPVRPRPGDGQRPPHRPQDGHGEGRAHAAGSKVGGPSSASRSCMTVGGPDLLVLDDQERPVALAGQPTARAAARWPRSTSRLGQLGRRRPAIGTFCRSRTARSTTSTSSTRPSRRSWPTPPAADGSGYPGGADGPPARRPAT